MSQFLKREESSQKQKGAQLVIEKENSDMAFIRISTAEVFVQIETWSRRSENANLA